MQPKEGRSRVTSAFIQLLLLFLNENMCYWCRENGYMAHRRSMYAARCCNF